MVSRGGQLKQTKVLTYKGDADGNGDVDNVGETREAVHNVLPLVRKGVHRDNANHKQDAVANEELDLPLQRKGHEQRNDHKGQSLEHLQHLVEALLAAVGLVQIRLCRLGSVDRLRVHVLQIGLQILDALSVDGRCVWSREHSTIGTSQATKRAVLHLLDLLHGLGLQLLLRLQLLLQLGKLLRRHLGLRQIKYVHLCVCMGVCRSGASRVVHSGG